MNKLAIPFAIAKSVYAIPLSYYKDNGIECIFLDLDNTLASYKDKIPSQEAKDLIKSLKEAGLKVAIASNNTSKRVNDFAEDLRIPAYCNLRKPFGGPLKKVMEKEKIDPNKTVLIGDQIMTDVYAGNRAGIKVILCNPLTELDPIWTKINRFLGKGKMTKLYQKPYIDLWKGIE